MELGKKSKTDKAFRRGIAKVREVRRQGGIYCPDIGKLVSIDDTSLNHLLSSRRGPRTQRETAERAQLMQHIHLLFRQATPSNRLKESTKGSKVYEVPNPLRGGGKVRLIIKKEGDTNWRLVTLFVVHTNI